METNKDNQINEVNKSNNQFNENMIRQNLIGGLKTLECGVSVE